jgi:hypothetical protein
MYRQKKVCPQWVKSINREDRKEKRKGLQNIGYQ